MSLSEQIMLAGVETFITGLKEHLLPIAKVNLLEEQRAEYERRLAVIMKHKGTSREAVVATIGEFVPDEAAAEKSFHGYVDNNITNRLTYAVLSYQKDAPIDCIRSIVLAMETLVFLEGRSDGFYRRLRDLDNKLWAMMERRS